MNIYHLSQLIQMHGHCIQRYACVYTRCGCISKTPSPFLVINDFRCPNESAEILRTQPHLQFETSTSTLHLFYYYVCNIWETGGKDCFT